MKLLPDQIIEADELKNALLRAARRLKAGLSMQQRAEEAGQADRLIRRMKAQNA